MNEDNKNSPDIYREAVKSRFEPTFLGKVMLFFGFAVLASAAGAFVTYNYFLLYFFASPWLMWLFFIVELAIIFTSRMWSQKIPLNRIMFALFAFITGVTIAPLLAVIAATPGGVAVITKALLATGFMFSATAIFGWVTKIDLSGLRGFLFITLIGMIIVGILGFFIPWSNQMEMVYSGIGVLLFSAFTAYDLQKIKHYPEDRYIDAALNLYLDIFNLFLYILRFINSNRN